MPLFFAPHVPGEKKNEHDHDDDGYDDDDDDDRFTR